MGNFVSFQLSCDQTVNTIFRCLCGKGYIRNLKKNLKALEKKMVDLKAIQRDVQNRLGEEERQHRQMLEVVKVWLTRVENICTRFNDLASQSSIQIEQFCFCGLCSKTVCSSYGYGKSIVLLIKEVETLKSEGSFQVVAELTPRLGVDEMPTQPTVGHEELLEKAWNRIMEDGIVLMGLHGMGGVGKTTLFKKIHNKFSQMACKFEIIIWVVVSQGVDISKLQDDIAEKLHLCGGRWTTKNVGDKAIEIYKVLKEKKFVLMLDDIWDKVDVEAMGVPFPTQENGCKVTFTTRSKEVCGRMGDHEPMQVNCLEPYKAWELFKKKVGDNTLNKDPNIFELAIKVAEKCDGLPLALNVIGETMASKTTVQEWDHAIDVLTTSAAEFSDMENNILRILKYSYDSLIDEQVKSSFLYCALFPEDVRIERENLINCWICEGFMGEYQVLKRAMNKGYEVLGNLIRVNLLTEVEGGQYVVVHDVIREMALWIASWFGKEKEFFVVKAKVGLLEIPKVNDWAVVKRMSLMQNKIQEITCDDKCSELTTLFFALNQLKNLPGAFIQSMKKLVVLDLAGNLGLNELPEQISELTSLRYIDLSFTSIVQLPVGFQELKKLTHLYLNDTYKLLSLCGISKLKSLIVLKLQRSKVEGDVNLLKEMQSLKNLQDVFISISTDLSLELLSNDKLLAYSIIGFEIVDFKEKSFDISLVLSIFENLQELRLEGNHFSEWCYLYNPPTRPFFTNLSFVRINGCHAIKDLTWLLLVPNLVSLDIENSLNVEEIINKEEEEAINLPSIVPFQKLKRMMFYDLPNLKRIYWTHLICPFLLHVSVRKCPKLENLPRIGAIVP